MLLAQLRPRDIYRDTTVPTHSPDRVPVVQVPGLEDKVFEAPSGIRNEQVQIDPHLRAQSLALGTGTVGGIEGKEAGLDTNISFRESDGSWTEPKNFGRKLGITENFFISLSPDGRHLFFGAGDVQWLDAGVIETLRD